jgi:hypothetical protein
LFGLQKSIGSGFRKAQEIYFNFNQLLQKVKDAGSKFFQQHLTRRTRFTLEPETTTFDDDTKTKGEGGPTALQWIEASVD